jgi:peptidoglycan/LPS O-acetylase OafA/YrhL
MGTIRFLLALSVAIGHYGHGYFLGLKFVDADTAVEAFFIISGFFMTYILNENPAYRSPITFYLSRYTRLFPTYAVIAVLSFVLTSEFALLRQHFAALQFPAQLLILVGNASLFFQDWFLFFQINYATGALEFTTTFWHGTTPQLNQFLLVPQAWSLGVELAFYVMSPWLARTPARLAVVMMLSLACRYGFYSMGLTADPWRYRSLPGELMLFAAGGLAYFAAREAFTAPPSRFHDGLAYAGLALIVGLCAARNLLLSSPDLVVAYPALAESIVLRDPIFLLLVALFTPLIFLLTGGSRVDALLGDLSYPLYLSHGLVATILTNLTGPLSHPATVPYVLALIAVSMALLVLVETPVKRLRVRAFGARPQSAARARRGGRESDYRAGSCKESERRMA